MLVPFPDDELLHSVLATGDWWRYRALGFQCVPPSSFYVRHQTWAFVRLPFSVFLLLTMLAVPIAAVLDDAQLRLDKPRPQLIGPEIVLFIGKMAILVQALKHGELVLDLLIPALRPRPSESRLAKPSNPLTPVGRLVKRFRRTVIACCDPVADLAPHLQRIPHPQGAGDGSLLPSRDVLFKIVLFARSVLKKISASTVGEGRASPTRKAALKAQKFRIMRW